MAKISWKRWLESKIFTSSLSTTKTFSKHHSRRCLAIRQSQLLVNRSLPKINQVKKKQHLNSAKQSSMEHSQRTKSIVNKNQKVAKFHSNQTKFSFKLNLQDKKRLKSLKIKKPTRLPLPQKSKKFLYPRTTTNHFFYPMSRRLKEKLKSSSSMINP